MGDAGVPAFEDVVAEGFVRVGEDGPCADVGEFFGGVAEGGNEGLVAGEDGAEFFGGADADGDGEFVDDACEAGFALFEFGDIEADAGEFEEFAVGAAAGDGDGADVADFAIGSDDAVFLFAAVAGGHGAEDSFADAFEVIRVDVVVPDPGEFVWFEAVEGEHSDVPVLAVFFEVVFPEADACGEGGDAHFAVGLGDDFFGGFVAGDVDDDAFPDGDAVVAFARGGFGGEPAGGAIDDGAAGPLEGGVMIEGVFAAGDDVGDFVWVD